MVLSRQSSMSPDSVDRILVGICVAIWLAVIGLGVAVVVVLADMGTGHRGDGDGGNSTPWLLYAVIAVSALIIVGAIPLLVRARRNALSESVRRPSTPARAARLRPTAGGAAPGTETATEKLREFGRVADSPRARGSLPPPRRLATGLAEDAVDRMWLRATVFIVGAMGVAMLAVTTATYLMGVDNDGAAWLAFGFAAVVTVVMPVIPLVQLRQLRSTISARR